MLNNIYILILIVILFVDIYEHYIKLEINNNINTEDLTEDTADESIKLLEPSDESIKLLEPSDESIKLLEPLEARFVKIPNVEATYQYVTDNLYNTTDNQIDNITDNQIDNIPDDQIYNQTSTPLEHNTTLLEHNTTPLEYNTTPLEYNATNNPLETSTYSEIHTNVKTTDISNKPLDMNLLNTDNYSEIQTNINHMEPIKYINQITQYITDTFTQLPDNEEKESFNQMSDLKIDINEFGKPYDYKPGKYILWEFSNPKPWSRIIYKYHNNYPYNFLIKIKIPSLNDYENWKNIIVNLNFNPKTGELIISANDEITALAIVNLMIFNFNGNISLNDIINKNLIEVSILKASKFEIVKNKLREQILYNLNNSSNISSNYNKDFEKDLASDLPTNISPKIQQELTNNYYYYNSTNKNTETLQAYEGIEYANI